MWGNLAKLFRLIDLLSRPGGATKKEIAELSGTGKRQVDRALNSIQNMGIPVYDDKPEGVREKSWFIEERYTRKLPNMTVPELGFTLPELFILCFFKGSSSIFQNTEISRYADSSFSKLKSFASDKMQDVFERMESAFISRERFAKNYSGLEDLLMDILGAIISRKPCTIHYNSFRSSAVKEYQVHPLHLFENDGGLYLMAEIEESCQIFTFAIERIKTVTIREKTFVYPPDFDAAKFLNQSFGIFMDEFFDCSIWFSADVARYITERTWSDNQTITKKAGGSIILTMQTYGWADVKRWVLSFGRDARVVAPDTLKTEILEEIRQTTALYGQ
jgi:predicted DNA-binding transcriptional regulator YafY